jgi:molybdopterin molybdotransferase
VAGLRTVDAALAAILERVEPLPSERVPLADAGGRILAADAVSTTDLPPFTSSAMDGFAIRAVDAPGSLAVVDRAAAGRPTSRSLGAGEAIGIATGAVVPEGADSVVPVELVVEQDNTIEIEADVRLGANVRPQGSDARAGETVLPAGRRLGPAQIGALAAAGLPQVSCTRRPNVSILGTGTELRQPGSKLGPGQIYESNGVMLETSLHGTGAAVTRLEPVADDRDSHRFALERGLEADVLVTSGGVSVGAHDLVRELERELGVEEVFWGVAVRPGKPLSFGIRGTTLVFGLPGNPVSSLVGCALFVAPALLALQGATAPGPGYSVGMLGTAVRQSESRDDFVRATAALTVDGVLLTPLSGQESHMIVRAAWADALVWVPRGSGELAAGSQVRYLRLD